jgi:peroxiredoxin Q/BCP
MLEQGQAAPAFKAKDHTGVDVTLADYAGKRLILWFYPKADTPG